MEKVEGQKPPEGGSCRGSSATDNIEGVYGREEFRIDPQPGGSFRGGITTLQPLEFSLN
jgi:hypothetical protein